MRWLPGGGSLWHGQSYPPGICGRRFGPGGICNRENQGDCWDFGGKCFGRIPAYSGCMVDEGALWFDDEPGVKNRSAGKAAGKAAEKAVGVLSGWTG